MSALLLVWLDRAAPRLRRASLDRAWPAVGFAVLVAAVGLIAYPVFDERESTGGGSDADDAVVLVIEGIRDGGDPYAVDTYLGNPATAGPGSALWFFPWSSRATYPIGIALAVGVTVVVLRTATGEWATADVVGRRAGRRASRSGRGSGRVRITSPSPAVSSGRPPTSTAGGRHRRSPVPSPSGSPSACSPPYEPSSCSSRLVAAATLWWRDRRAAIALGVTGTVVALALHAALISRSSWDGYDPVQQLLVKSDEDLNTAGRVLLVVGVIAAAVGVLAELRRRAGARIDVILLVAVGVPMISIAVAELLAATKPADWVAATYFLDTVALAAAWVAGSVLARAT